MTPPDPRRLRAGEWLAALSAIALLVFLLALPWYGIGAPLGQTLATLGRPTSFSGWNTLAHLRWLLVVTIAVALALAWFQATRRAPAIPAALSVIVTVLGGVTTLALIYRVAINVPGASYVGQRAGAWLGLASAVGIAYGGYRSLRQEGIPARDAPQAIETVRLPGRREPAAHS